MADIDTGTPTGRALALRQTEAPAATRRPLADFVTQLIACNRGLTPYRQARRGGPDQARDAYSGQAVADAKPPAPPSHLDLTV